MGPAAFIIAIMGCADGGSACTPVATLPARFETQAACVAATPAALYENTQFDYPTIVAQCQRQSERPMVEKKGSPRATDGGRSGAVAG